MAKTLIGTVVSTKMNKVVTVSVETKTRHPFYKKVIVRHKKMKARNEEIELTQGDKVEIKETRPLAKTVHFVVTKKL